MLVKNEELPPPVLERMVVSTLSPNDHTCKTIAKRKGRWASDIIQKKVRKEDCSSKMDVIKREEDGEEFEMTNYVKHDKKYFFVRSANIRCKLCGFKGKLIVQHYRMKHPEREVLISRIDPDITAILIEDAIQNREEYDKNHLELKMKCNFKCPFCLMIIKNTPNAYYDHISSHTGEYRFHCDHCSYSTYNGANMRAHLNQLDYKIHKRRYKTVYPDPKIFKYVFGHICSQCNFVQLIRRTVEKHVMVYHPGSPEIHRVNLGMLLHEDAVDGKCMNENHSNLNNCIRVTTSAADIIHNQNLKTLAEDKELSVLDVSSQIEELEEVKVKIELEVLEDDPHPIELSTFICHPDMDIKQDSESSRTEMLQWINENTKEARTSISDRLQTNLIIESVEEGDKIQTDTPSLISPVTQDMEEMLNSKVKFPGFSKQLVLTSGDHSKCISVLTDIPMTDIKKQDRSYLKAAMARMKPSLLNPLYKCPKNNSNFNELVSPYNCEDDGFPNCPFQTLYFGKYLKHVEANHQIDGLGSFSSEPELLRGTIMEEWLAKGVGPFQCRYCKKATVTHQEMERHQAVFHSQKQSWFYYRKFVPNDTVIIPEQVNLQDPSFINHVIHLPDQIHLCDFKLTDSLFSLTSDKLMEKASETSLPQLPSRDPEVHLNQSEALLDEPEIFSLPTDNEGGPLGESDPLYLDDELLKDNSSLLDVKLADEVLPKSTERKCKWEGCYQAYLSQTALVKHIKNHVKLQRGEKFTCFWINCPRKWKPYNRRYSLLLHMRIHSGEKPNKCSFQGCNKAFSELGNLKAHQRSHTGERPYICQYSNCFKSFSTSGNRDTHQRTHYDIKPYACKVTGCSKKYADPSGVRRHMKNHMIDNQLEVKQESVKNKQMEDDLVLKKSSNSSDEDKHQTTHYESLQCKWEGCYQIYRSQSALVNHLQKNHGKLQRGGKFTCFWTNCPRKLIPFTTKPNLLGHMKVHGGEKPNKCPFQGCNKAFTRLETLKTHQRSHTGERPYLCQFPNCFKSFSYRARRSNHQRVHYDTKPYTCQANGSSEKYTNSSDLE